MSFAIWNSRTSDYIDNNYVGSYVNSGQIGYSPSFNSPYIGLTGFNNESNYGIIDIVQLNYEANSTQNYQFWMNGALAYGAGTDGTAFSLFQAKVPSFNALDKFGGFRLYRTSGSGLISGTYSVYGG